MRLSFIWTYLLRNRSVTVEADETICGAILMNLDLKRLIAASKSDRVKVFWNLMGESANRIPLAVLFVPGPRLKDKGYSWAPASLLPCEKAGTQFKTLCTISEEGLRVKLGPYSAFELDNPQYPVDELLPCILQDYKYFIKKSPNKTNPSWEGLDLQYGPKLAIIFEFRKFNLSKCFPTTQHAAPLPWINFLIGDRIFFAGISTYAAL